jgi:hypothetical protein
MYFGWDSVKFHHGTGINMASNQLITAMKRLKPGAYLFLSVVFVNILLQKTIGPDLNSGNFGDAGQYLKSAEAIYLNREYPRILEEWPTFRMPGYPLVISLIWQFTSLNSIVALKIFNAICVGVTATIIYKIANRHLTKSFALFAGYIIGFNPFLYLQSTEVSTEVLTMTMFLIFVYLLSGQDFPYRIIVLSFLVVSLTFIRPEYIFICLPILMWIVIRSESRIIQVGAVFLIIVTPLHLWGLQNQKATGSYLLSNSGNFQLWMGSTETIKGNYPLTFKSSTNFSRDQFLRLKDEIAAVQEKHSFIQSPKDVDRQSDIWFQEYKTSVETAPIDYMKNVIYKGLAFWRPFLNPPSYSPIEVFVSLLVFLPSFLVTVIGVFASYRRRFFKRELAVFLFSFLPLTLIHAIQMPDLRYRITILEPFSALMISVAISVWVKNRAFKE